MANRPRGVFNASFNLEPKISGELDARKLCPTYADLALPATWEDEDGNSFIPKGFTTAVYDDPDITKNGLYFLKDLPFTLITNWDRIGEKNEVSFAYTKTLVSSDFNLEGKTTISHNLSSSVPIVVVYNDKNEYILPDEVILIDSNTIELDMNTYHATMQGIYTVAIISGSTNANTSYIQTFTASDFDVSGNLSITHDMDNITPVFAIYNNNNRQILPDDVVIINANTLQISMDSYIPTMDGIYKIIIATDKIVGGETEYTYTHSFVSTDFDAEGKLNIIHNLNTRTPVFALYNNSNKYILPDFVKALSTTSIQLDMSSYITTMTGTYQIALTSGYKSNGQSGSEVDEAPIDGKQYGRQNAMWTEIVNTGGALKYSQTFTNDDLSAGGVLEVTHDLGTEDVVVSVYDNDKFQIIVGQTQIISNNQINIEILMFMPITGNYKVVVIG